MNGFIAELRRRNVLRVAAAYALIAWIIIEAGSVLLPTFGADEATFQLYVIFVFTGFVIALICAWVFEITPDGVKLERDIDRNDPATNKPNHTMNFAIIGLLVVALIVSVTFNVVETPFVEETTIGEEMSMRRSIAVLPFTSRSSDPDNVFFADGIHDDLLTKLAKFGTFKVISRTSVLEYRDTAKNLVQIGEELGVDTILEGSVQKLGDDVRINVQLIDAATDEHLWAQIYDRSLGEQSIFAIQSDVSAEISNALQLTLMPERDFAVADVSTENLRAYSLYVSGRDNLYLRRQETLQEARLQFEEAVEIDPNYAEAYVGLAESVLLMSINHGLIPFAQADELVQANLEKAIAINPDLSDAYATFGLLLTTRWQQTRVGTENLEAEAAFEQAIGLNPNSAQAYMWFATLRTAEQRFEDAIGLYHRSMQLDPLGRIPYSNLPTLYAQLGQNDIAIKLLLEAIEIHPEWPTPYQYMARHLALLGRLDEGLAWNKLAQDLSDESTFGGDGLRMGIYVQFGDIEKAKSQLATISPDHPLAPFAEGYELLIEGNYGAALAFLDNIVSDNDQAPIFVLELAADLALQTGNFEEAERLILRREPLLRSDSDKQVDRINVQNVVKLAYIYQNTGDVQKANELLASALEIVQSMPRLGMFGHGILDVQIHALMGRKEDAFGALRAAIGGGFRSSILFDGWLLATDPLLSSIRDDLRFSAIVEELDSLNEEMHERVRLAEQTDNWEPLAARARAN